MDNKILEIFIPGPAGRLEAKYFKSKKNTSPIALVLQPHPQYGGTMNNKVVVETFNAFMENVDLRLEKAMLTGQRADVSMRGHPVR